MIFSRPFRKPFWILKSFFNKHQKLILISTLIAIIGFLSVKNLIPLLPRIKPNKSIGIVGLYTLNNLPLEISSTISRGLVKLDDSGQIIPDLAKSWEILEDETLYKVYLNPNIFWNDGTRVVSKDLQLEIPDVEISYPKENIIEFKLKESYSPFLSLLSRPVFKNNQTGAGDYSIKTIKKRGPYLKSITLNGKTQTLSYKFYPSYQGAWLGFKLGEVDTLKNLISNPLTDKWLNKVTLEQKINQNQYIAIIFNLQHPIFSSKSLRQALAYALKDKSPNEESRALTPINPNSWAYNNKVKPYDFNQDQALELFEKAKEEASISGQLEINLGTSQTLLPKAEAIAKSWEETLNLKTNVKIINSIDQGFEAVLIVQEIPIDPDQHALWHSTQESNISKFSDLKVDKLLEDGRKILSQTKRKEIYQDFQKFLSEELPAIFLEHPTTYTISR